MQKHDTEVKLLKDVVTKSQKKVSCLASWVGGLVRCFYCLLTLIWTVWAAWIVFNSFYFFCSESSSKQTNKKMWLTVSYKASKKKGKCWGFFPESLLEIFLLLPLHNISKEKIQTLKFTGFSFIPRWNMLTIIFAVSWWYGGDMEER